MLAAPMSLPSRQAPPSDTAVAASRPRVLPRLDSREVAAIFAGGALGTYVWVCPIQTASFGVPLPLVAAGWVLYGTIAVTVLVLARRALRRRPAAPSAESGSAACSRP